MKGLTVAIACLLALPAAAAAGDALPARWSVGAAADGGAVLRFTAPASLPIGDGRVEFRLGGELVGYPRVDGAVASLDVGALPAGDLGRLQVWRSGRRIDRAAPAAGRPVPAAPSPAAPRPPLVATDPARPGPYAVASSSYVASELAIAPFPAPVEVAGDVIAPVGAPGARPLILFLHGRHSSCFRDGPSGLESGDWPCPPGWTPVPSHLGYRYLAQRLASQGYVTVSIAANGINGQDFAADDGGADARSRLVRHHLDLWRRWAAGEAGPLGTAFAGKVDPSRVVLVGHSRGGEGVARATIDADPAAGYTIRGVVLFGATAFGHQAPAGRAITSILPYCDGDVLDLQGQSFVDAAVTVPGDPALRSALLMMGANHNFFNTEWTPGLAAAPAVDDWFDDANRFCGAPAAARLSAAEQRAAALTYTTAAVEATLGGSRDAVRLLDGTPARARSQGRATVLASALGARRRPLIRLTATPSVRPSAGMIARVCRGYDDDSTSGAVCAPRIEGPAQPHWLAPAALPPSPRAIALRWSRRGAGATGRLRRVADLGGSTHVDLRVAVDRASAAAQLGVRLIDDRGRSVDLVTTTAVVRPLPGADVLGKLWAQTIRARIPRGSGVSLARIRTVVLTSRSAAGRVYLLDAHGRQSGVSRRRFAAARLDAETATIPEGAGGPRTQNIHIRVAGALSAPARIWLRTFESDGAPGPGRVLVIPAGASEVTVPFTYTADDLYSPVRQRRTLLLDVLSGGVAGVYGGGLIVTEDEATPTFAVTPLATAPEGSALTWNVTLSAPVAVPLFYPFAAVADTASANELTTADVSDASLTVWGMARDPVRPLHVRAASSGSAFQLLEIPALQLTTPLTIEVRDDGISEPAETVAIRLDVGLCDDPVVTARSRRTDRCRRRGSCSSSARTGRSSIPVTCAGSSTSPSPPRRPGSTPSCCPSTSSWARPRALPASWATRGTTPRRAIRIRRRRGPTRSCSPPRSPPRRAASGSRSPPSSRRCGTRCSSQSSSRPSTSSAPAA
jgi:dienelactone hydrolase